MRVTVTGGAGFIGSHLVDRLIRSGHRVQVVDNLVTGLREQIPEAAEWFDGCITAASTAEAVADFAPQRLVHLAAQVDVRVSVNEPVHDAMINVAGTVAMLGAAQRGGSLEAAVLASSAAVYGVQRTPLAQEDHPIEPISGYGAAKRAAEVYWAQMGRLHGVRTPALRFANVYGPRQGPKGEAGVIAIFCRRHAAGQALRVFGDGLATRDYLFVHDVVDALWRVADAEDARDVYNLGTGTETSVLELTEHIERISGRAPKVLFEPARTGEVVRSALGAQRAEQTFDWRAETPLAKGLTITYAELTP